VAEKQQADQAETAKLIAQGTPVARINTGIDGGMNKVFASKLPDGSTGLSEGGDGQGLSLVALSRAPGTIPSHVNPPRGPVTSPDEPLAASMAQAQTPAAPATRVASAAPNAQSDSFFSSLARKVGLGGAADTTAASPPPAVPAKPKIVEAKRSDQVASVPKTAAAATPKPDTTKQAAARPAPKPALADPPPAAAPAKDGMVAGAQPIVSPNSFDSRFQSFR
jgi:hypothetical protein